MDLLLNILTVLAIIVFIALAISLIILTTSAKKFLSDVSKNIERLSKDMRIIREKTSEVIDEVNIFSKKMNNIASGIEDLKDVAVDSMANLRGATYEIKSMISKLKENTSKCSDAFHNAQNHFAEFVGKVSTPFMKIGSFIEGFSSIFNAFKRK